MTSRIDPVLADMVHACARKMQDASVVGDFNPGVTLLACISIVAHYAATVSDPDIMAFVKGQIDAWYLEARRAEMQ